MTILTAVRSTRKRNRGRTGGTKFANSNTACKHMAIRVQRDTRTVKQQPSPHKPPHKESCVCDCTCVISFASAIITPNQRSYRARREKFSDFSPHSHHCQPFPGLALYCRGSDFVHEFSTVLLRRFFFLEFQAFTQEDDGTFGWNVRFVPATPHSRGLGRTGRARLCLCDEAIFAVRSEGKNGRIGFSYPSRRHRRRRLRLVGTL